MEGLPSALCWPPTPPNMPFQRRRKCIFHWHGWAWLTIWDRIKIPRYTHRLMHRKRVTCELHDSYFRLMTIKHANQKTAAMHIPLAWASWLTIWDRVKIPRYSHRLMHRKRVTCELHDSYFRLMTIKHANQKTAGNAYSIGVGELGWQYGTGLKSHATLTDWCTGREWPVNYMTVISAWWRSNMPFQRRRKYIFHWRGWAWLTIWDRVKIPRYSHRLMHRKRVTCELHDSYFRLMTIKHANQKTGGSAYSIGMGELGWQYGTGLKSHATLTDWCTGRKWPVNCMTVISAWWRSNMPFQRRRKCRFRWPVMGRYWVGVNYYITECTGNSISLERRCGREKQHPAEGALRTPDWEFGDQTSWWQDAVEKVSTQRRAGHSGLRLSS